MIITIDTAKDSKDEIERAIRLLSEVSSGSVTSSVVENDQPSVFNLFGNDDNKEQAPSSTPAPAMNMFGDNSTSSEEKPAESSPVFNIFDNPVEEKKEDEEEDPQDTEEEKDFDSKKILAELKKAEETTIIPY